MPTILINIVLPFALSLIRSYLNSPSSKNDGQILQLTKDSIAYLAQTDTTNVNFGHYATIQYADVKAGL